MSWMSVLTATGNDLRKFQNFINFLPLFDLAVKIELASNLLPKKEPYLLVGQPKVLTLLKFLYYAHGFQEFLRKFSGDCTCELTCFPINQKSFSK
jgi:hypothetical protein